MTMSKLTPATEPSKPIIVIKLGGSMIDHLTDAFYKSFHDLRLHFHIIVVHGGGPSITSMLKRLNIKSEFHNGLRKTTKETMEVVKMSLAGTVNAQITSRLAEQHIYAIGLKGSDCNMLTARFVDQNKLGFVGEVVKVELDFLYRCMEAGYIPVIAPLGKTQDGQTVNINADLAASAIAKGVLAEKLLFVTDVPGILLQGDVVNETTPQEVQELINNGSIHGGMIPKVESAVYALSEHLQEVMIVSGKRALMEANRMTGTIIRKEKGMC
ncbi:acetylglutamate kinase [Virgibacillus byunsanensis]|uniref:Acetylglutamate kinase n=1 Tax=Virgibacillus byunsanensis TaxID=570945 RepID=A0ABW3LTW1_9BACI